MANVFGVLDDENEPVLPKTLQALRALATLTTCSSPPAAGRAADEAGDEAAT